MDHPRYCEIWGMVLNHSTFLYAGVWHKGALSLGVTESFQLSQKLV